MALYYGVGREATSTGGSVEFDGYSDLDLKGHKVVNLGHRVEEGDACNLKYVTNKLGVTKRGPKGDQSDVGKMGPAGRQGPKGDKGDVGLQGPKGDHGPTGRQGCVWVARRQG